MSKESTQHPIDRIIDAVSKAASGDDDVRVDASGENDRISALPDGINQMFRLSVDHAPDAVFWLGREGNFEYVNKQACRSLGYTREELMALRLWDIDPLFPEDRWRDWWDGHWQDGKEGTLQHETRHRRKDGAVFPVEVSARHFWFDDHEFHVAFVRDITARNQAEAALRESIRLLNESQSVARMGHYSLNAVTGCWECSETLDEVLGIDDRYPKTVDGWLQMVHPEHRQDMGLYLSQTVIQERAPFDREYRIIRPADGREIWVHGLGRLESDGEGKVLRMIGTIQNIDLRKRLEAQLLQSQKMEAVGQLAGGVAHDFNNMLSVILGYAELIRTRLTPDDPLNREILEIEKAATRSRDITRQLLAFSRKQIISPRVMDLNRRISETLNTLSRLIGEDIQLRFFPQKDLQDIRFDPAQIDQILFNLAVNARDAMPAGGKLTIETAGADLDEAFCRTHIHCNSGPHVLLTVSDNGTGIDPADLPHVFEPFFTTKAVDKGTGLGLATVYGIVKQNGGYVSVYSEPGRGTTFRIYIPRDLTAGDADRTAVRDSSAESLTASPMETVLLVEDDEMVRNIARAMLEKLGYTVAAALTPTEALAFCRNAAPPPTLLMTDVVMPEMNGIELRDRIKEIQPEIRVLFMSGYTTNVIVHHGVLEEGVNFIHKPFNMSDLARKVRDAIESG